MSDDYDDDYEYALTEEAVRSSHSMNAVKARLRMNAIWDIIFFAIGIVVFLYLTKRVPFFPPSLLEYGLLYHMPHAGWFLLQLAASGSISEQLFGITGFVGIFVIILDMWALVTTLIWFVSCILGNGIAAVNTCGVGALYNITLLVLCIALVWFSYGSTSYAFDAIRYLRRHYPQNMRWKNPRKNL